MSHEAQSEMRHLHEVEVLLAHEFPRVPGDQLRQLLATEYEGFREAKVRDFVPLLVQRAARSRLRDRIADPA